MTTYLAFAFAFLALCSPALIGPSRRSVIEQRDRGISDGAAQRLDRVRRAMARRVHAIAEQRDPAAARQIEPQRRAGEAGVADRAGARPAIAGVRDARD